MAQQRVPVVIRVAGRVDIVYSDISEPEYSAASLCGLQHEDPREQDKVVLRSKAEETEYQAERDAASSLQNHPGIIFETQPNRT